MASLKKPIIFSHYVRLTSSQKNRPLKFRVDENYDYIKGWQTNPEDTNEVSDDEDKGGC